MKKTSNAKEMAFCTTFIRMAQADLKAVDKQKLNEAQKLALRTALGSLSKARIACKYLKESYMKNGILVFFVLTLISCGKAPEVDLPNVPASTPAGTISGGSGGSSNTVSLTYYSKTETRNPVSGWPYKTATFTGYCTVYLTKTYCWDDGMKTMAWKDPVSGANIGPFTYSYFNISTSTTPRGWSHSSGGMTADFMTSPTLITSGGALKINMDAGIVDGVLAGTPTTVNCTEQSNGNLNCGTFTVDVNQPVI